MCVGGSFFVNPPSGRGSHIHPDLEHLHQPISCWDVQPAGEGGVEAGGQGGGGGNVGCRQNKLPDVMFSQCWWNVLRTWSPDQQRHVGEGGGGRGWTWSGWSVTVHCPACQWSREDGRGFPTRHLTVHLQQNRRRSELWFRSVRLCSPGSISSDPDEFKWSLCTQVPISRLRPAEAEMNLEFLLKTRKIETDRKSRNQKSSDRKTVEETEQNRETKVGLGIQNSEIQEHVGRGEHSCLFMRKFSDLITPCAVFACSKKKKVMHDCDHENIVWFLRRKKGFWHLNLFV